MLWLGLEGRKKLKELENGQKALEDDLARYVRQCKQLETEWSDTLDRVNHFMGRAVARTRRMQPADQVQDERPAEYRHLDQDSWEIVKMRRRNGRA